MRTPNPFILYGTAACHLCEQAAEMLSGPALHQLEFDEIDISDDDQLLAQYGTRIPVLHHVRSGHELDWPFDRRELDSFLRRLS